MTTMVDITKMADDRFLVARSLDWVKAEGAPVAQRPVRPVALDHRDSRN